jgi:small subunit ribosomal protein S4
MARYRGPKQKLARRFKEPIFGFSKALERKPYGPGQHGKGRRSKPSDYSIQLNEKQKARFMYGMLEKQFRSVFHKASRKSGNTGEIFMQLLESRLDNTVFRMGFAPTRRAARQLVTHKHILVNGRWVNIPSYQLRPGDVVEVRERSKALEIINDALNSAALTFGWLDVDKAAFKGTFLKYPERAEIPEKIEERLIVELYSR